MRQAIAYLRVSTSEQGKSGLGLEAQEADVRAFCDREGFELIEVVREVQTGKGYDVMSRRPKFASVIRRSKKEKVSIIVAKLDRLARDSGLIEDLMRDKLDFIVTTLGENPDPFVVRLMAALSMKERELISERTKSALKVLKDKGVKLGNPNLESLSDARDKGNAKIKKHADAFALEIAPMIRGLQKEGLGMGKVADRMNTLNLKTRHGKEWYASSIRAVLLRADALEEVA